MSTEIPIWLNGKIRWMSGIDKKTTCKDVVEVLLEGEGMDKTEVKDFAIMERWRKVERPLDENSKILKIWSHWGNEKKEVRLCLRRIDNEVDSGRGSPIGSGHTPSLRRKRNRGRGTGKPPWAHPETLHPRRLAELGRFGTKEYDDYHCMKPKQSETNTDSDRQNEPYIYNKLCNYEEIYDKMNDIENLNNRKKSGLKSYHCSGTGRLHSTLLSSTENHSKRTSKCCSKREAKQKVRNSENIEKLMKLILAQGATIQNQLQKLKEREEQIESLEHERHRERVEKNGRNYLLETYLGSLKDAEIPTEVEDKKGNDSGVHTEAGSDQNSPASRENAERLNQIKTESDVDKSSKVYRRGQLRAGHRSEDASLVHHTGSKKSTRSKSESRTHESKLEGNLKRTLSDNAIAESGGVLSDGGNKETGIERQNTKEEEFEEVVELRRIQSQIEMWEKVFKINKKLEKEEENLVRLHIKIKKFQSENYRVAKEKSESSEENVVKSDSQELNGNKKEEPEEITLEEDCVEVQRNLETLRSDLEQNSKEIYQNFTRLIEDDEAVEQKRTCLTQLISDLERTVHEHDMLNQMIAMKESESSAVDQATSFCEDPEPTGTDFQNRQQPAHPQPIDFIQGDFANPEIPPDGRNMCSNLSEVPNKIHDDFNQRLQSKTEQENFKSIKPKIVKISFDDQIQNYESSDIGGQRKSPKDPPPAASGTLKSILKNRKYAYDKTAEKRIFSNQNYQELPHRFNNEDRNNLKVDNGYVPIQYNYPPVVPNKVTSNYPYSVPYPLYNHFSHEPSQNFYGQPSLAKLSEDLKTTYPLRNTAGIPRASNTFPHSTMITTKALVHNDTDSSTSSDTSGLSSMHSSSPTVEEHYVEPNYVLDTLV